MKIENLVEKDTVLDDDYLIVNGTDGTKKAKKSNFLSELKSSLTPTEIEIETTIDGIYAYRMGRQVFVFMENMSRPAWSAGYIATGLPKPINNFVVVGYRGTPFSFGDDKIYSDGIDSSEWESFAASYITAE